MWPAPQIDLLKCNFWLSLCIVSKILTWSTRQLHKSILHPSSWYQIKFHEPNMFVVAVISKVAKKDFVTSTHYFVTSTTYPTPKDRLHDKCALYHHNNGFLANKKFICKVEDIYLLIKYLIFKIRWLKYFLW